MKKSALILFSLLTLVSIMSGCRRAEDMMPTTMPTRPMMTETVRPADPIPGYQEGTRETIEDGNGPIPSQKPAVR